MSLTRTCLVLFLFLSCALEIPGFAAAKPRPQEGYFFKATDGQAPVEVAKAAQAVEVFVDGSMAYVSGNGYLVTSLSSITPCLAATGQLKVDRASNRGWAARVVTDPARENNYCPFAGGAKYRIVLVGKNATYLWSALGQSTAEDIQRLREIGSLGEDFAVIRHETAKPTSCVPVNYDPILPGQRLFAIGQIFSHVLGENPGISSTGTPTRDTIAYTRGVAISSLRESAYVLPEREAYLSRIEELLTGSGAQLTTLDYMNGFNGSPVFNEKGEVVGVSSSTIIPWDEFKQLHKYTRGTTVITPMSKIADEIRKIFGEAALKEIFNCRQ